ncbi:MAG TPA: NADH:ubiquinone oxidoreductase [Clostridiales bacterium]|nr:MAG: NADH:ubiquinone oxidoreductase [Clostridiales bacterium GWD2_32_59]HAN09833.1 NADH:ubiquinone oxidoreductase [Clostridiales bacterium]
MGIILDRIKYGNETKKDILFDNPDSYGKVNVDSDKCNGCTKCVNECVANAIEIKKGKAVVDYKKCIYCRNCIGVCDKLAIEMEHDCKFCDIEQAGNELARKIYEKFKRSLVLRSVDTGSCNACMLELSATQNTYYDISRFGVKFAASPRHSDGIVVTGPVTINMREALIKTYNAMPEPKLVIAVGTCSFDGGIFKDGYGNVERLSDIMPVDLYIPGCPPSPQGIVYGLLKLIDRI